MPCKYCGCDCCDEEMDMTPRIPPKEGTMEWDLMQVYAPEIKKMLEAQSIEARILAKYL